LSYFLSSYQEFAADHAVLNEKERMSPEAATERQSRVPDGSLNLAKCIWKTMQCGVRNELKEEYKHIEVVNNIGIGRSK
ncbi:hypothetical protein SUGI_0268770, partial [Cryptomeria japonica]